jgi:spore germination protein
MQIYVVKSGDSIFKIAREFGVSAESIIDVNELTMPDRLVVGQALVIPTGDRYHTVRAGDSLWKIAQTYGTTVQAILQANTITDPNRIYPGTVLRIPSRYRPVIDVNGYIYNLGNAAVPAIRSVNGLMTYICPFAYRIKEDGDLEAIDDIPAINAAYSIEAVPLMGITNFTSTELGENLAHVVLSDLQIIDRLFANILTIMRQKGYLGLNIDFENVLPEDRENYNRFISLAVERLHPYGYSVSSALAPKTSGEQAGLLYTAHDYPEHGRVLDFIVLMTYEWGYRLGPPRAISPIDQIRRVLDYAVSVIPRNKLFMGFQIYARDWLLPHKQGQSAETFSNQKAIERAIQYGAVINYDSVAQSPYYRYTDAQGRMHEVWFEDARSAQAKFDTVKEYGLRGISYWALGPAFPQNWALLGDNFIIRKRI